MKVGEFYTTEHIVIGGAGFNYAPVRLTGEVALLSSDIIPIDPKREGAPFLQSYTFQFLRPGKAEIQLAFFRSFDLNDIAFDEIMTFEVEEAKEECNDTFIKTGCWSTFENLNEEDKAVFEEATKGLCGGKYDPILVSRQVVHGMNYRFYCHSTLVVEKEMPMVPAIVKIYVVPGAKAEIIQILRLDM